MSCNRHLLHGIVAGLAGGFVAYWIISEFVAGARTSSSSATSR